MKKLCSLLYPGKSTFVVLISVSIMLSIWTSMSVEAIDGICQAHSSRDGDSYWFVIIYPTMK